MSRHRLARTLVLVALGVVAACGPAERTSATVEGACAAPLTGVSETTVAAGQAIVVAAHDMWSEPCRDHDSVAADSSLGCAPSRAPARQPASDQSVVWLQDGGRVFLETVDADAEGLIEVSVVVPREAHTGPAELRIGDAEPATLTVRAPR